MDENLIDMRYLRLYKFLLKMKGIELDAIPELYRNEIVKENQKNKTYV